MRRQDKFHATLPRERMSRLLHAIIRLVKKQLKYLIIKLLKEKSLNNVEIKTNLINYLWDNYIKKNILQEEYLGNLISQWISKIKT